MLYDKSYLLFSLQNTQLGAEIYVIGWGDHQKQCFLTHTYAHVLQLAFLNHEIPIGNISNHVLVLIIKIFSIIVDYFFNKSENHLLNFKLY